MCSLFRANVILSLAMLLATSAVANGGKKPTFRICAEPDNLPMSSRETKSGFEIELAQLIADELQSDLVVEWVPQRDPSFFRRTIGSGACDAIMSVPTEMEQMTMTKPLYRTGFVAIARESHLAPKSLGDASLKKLKIGVPELGDGDTAAALALSRHGFSSNLHPYSILDQRRLVEAVAKREVDVALVWGPYGWWAKEKGANLAVNTLPDRDGDFPLAYDVAIGVKKGNHALKGKLDAAIEKKHDAIMAVLQKWRVPVRNP